MEKLIYLLGQPEGSDREQLKRELHDTAIPALQKAGAGHIRSCVRDASMAPAERLRRGEMAEQTWCYLSLWAPSRTHHPALRQWLQTCASFLHAYAVSESEQLFHDFQPDGSRVEGMNQVVCLRKPEQQDRADFLANWLESHTQIAIDTQSTFGYIQNIVVDAIEPGSPHYDGIVEENFPAAAMSSDEGFYDAEGEELQQRIEGMIASCIRFIDLESIQVMPMSEYNF